MDETQARPWSWRAAVVLVLTYSVSTMGCNLYGRLDPPGEAQDKYAAAIAAANDGRCADALDLLKTIQFQNDDILAAVGWANLCVAGATAALIASSLYKFSAGSTDYSAVGTLAQTLLPMSGTKSQAISQALQAFGNISDGGRQHVTTGIAQLVQAASILANQAGLAGSGALEKIDIAGAGCAGFSTSCPSAPVACAAGMSDADVTSFSATISNAAGSLSTSGAGDLQALATALRTGLSGTANAGRCFIFNNMIP